MTCKCDATVSRGRAADELVGQRSARYLSLSCSCRCLVCRIMKNLFLRRKFVRNATQDAFATKSKRPLNICTSCEACRKLKLGRRRWLNPPPNRSIIVACITVGGSRNGPSPTTNSTPKSEASTANSILVCTNRYFVYQTSLALYIYKSRI